MAGILAAGARGVGGVDISTVYENAPGQPAPTADAASRSIDPAAWGRRSLAERMHEWSARLVQVLL